MLSCLSFFDKPRLKLPRLGTNNQHGNIGLTRTHYHVGYKVFMSRRIKQSESPHTIREYQLGILNGNALESLGWVDVCNTGELPGLHVVLFGLEFGAGPLLLVDFVELFENVSSEGGFT